MGRAAWNLRAAFYDMAFRLPLLKGLRNREKAAVEELVEGLELKDAKLLDVACGTGYYLACFRGAGASIGIDISERMLGISRRKVPLTSLVLGDAGTLPFKDGSMDLVLCIGLLEYFEEIEGIVLEIRRVLKGGGHAVVSYSVRSPLNALRGLLGSRIYPCTGNEMTISLNNCRLKEVRMRTSLIQGAVLCRKE